MAPEGLSLEFGTRAEGSLYCCCSAAFCLRLTRTLCSGAANLLFFHEHKILAFLGGKKKKKTKKTTKKAPYVQRWQRLLVTAII